MPVRLKITDRKRNFIKMFELLNKKSSFTLIPTGFFTWFVYASITKVTRSKSKLTFQQKSYATFFHLKIVRRTWKYVIEVRNTKNFLMALDLTLTLIQRMRNKMDLFHIQALNFLALMRQSDYQSFR